MKIAVLFTGWASQTIFIMGILYWLDGVLYGDGPQIIDTKRNLKEDVFN